MSAPKPQPQPHPYVVTDSDGAALGIDWKQINNEVATPATDKGKKA